MNETSKKLELVGAKIPPELKEAIEQRAATEDRSISKTIARLLASHPELSKIKPEKVAAGNAELAVS